MKLSRTSWIILSVGIFVIVAGGLGAIYRAELSEQGVLSSQLALLQVTLPTVISEREEAENRLTEIKAELAQAESKLDASKLPFTKSIESIEYGEILYNIAHGLQIDIINFTATDARQDKGDVVTYYTTRFEIEVEGDETDILDYVHQIALSANFATATVELAEINIPEPPTDEELEDENYEPEKPRAIINLVIYEHRGE